LQVANCELRWKGRCVAKLTTKRGIRGFARFGDRATIRFIKVPSFNATEIVRVGPFVVKALLKPIEAITGFTGPIAGCIKT